MVLNHQIGGSLLSWSYHLSWQMCNVFLVLQLKKFPRVPEKQMPLEEVKLKDNPT